MWGQADGRRRWGEERSVIVIGIAIANRRSQIGNPESRRARANSEAPSIPGSAHRFTPGAQNTRRNAPAPGSRFNVATLSATPPKLTPPTLCSQSTRWIPSRNSSRSVAAVEKERLTTSA